MNSNCLIADRFPRASKYNAQWIRAGASGGANPLWLAEWLAESLDLQPGMKVLDLGCGRALSSIFLSLEFGVQVWATDLWFSASENQQRVCDAGLEKCVFPLRADARSLPFSEQFFDAIVSIDSFMYYGTDDYYLNYLGRFLKPRGKLGIAQAGLMHELDETIPDHMAAWWAAENPYSLHSAEWWRKHWQRTRIVEVEVADTLHEGWQYWRDWMHFLAPESQEETQIIQADAGRNLGYVRAVAKLRDELNLFDPMMSMPCEYSKYDVFRNGT